MKSCAAALALLLVACGDDAQTAPSDADVDAAISAGPCWPDVEHVAQGSVTLGTGRSGFEPMPAELPLEYGSQDGFMFIAHARMTGFAPGNPESIIDPSNPRTRVRAYFADTGAPLNVSSFCPFRNAYVEAAGGAYDLEQEVGVVFDTCWRSDRLIGKQFRIELELMDDTGGYASDTRTVTAAAPLGPYPAEQDTPPCPAP